MTDRLPYEGTPKELRAEWRGGKADPRLIALARFLGRRAAERDYQRLLDQRREERGDHLKEGD